MLYHFSDDPGITRFVPRPVRTTAPRRVGQEWLNGPLVWAICDTFAFLYLFPRDCPRIVTWAVENTSKNDKTQWLGAHKRVAYVEQAWMDRITTAQLIRYTLPQDSFMPLGDVGMHVSRTAVKPQDTIQLSDLPTILALCGVSLRPVSTLLPLRRLWDSTLHVSGVRLRNAAGWN